MAVQHVTSAGNVAVVACRHLNRGRRIHRCRIRGNVAVVQKVDHELLGTLAALALLGRLILLELLPQHVPVAPVPQRALREHHRRRVRRQARHERHLTPGHRGREARHVCAHRHAREAIRSEAHIAKVLLKLAVLEAVQERQRLGDQTRTH